MIHGCLCVFIATIEQINAGAKINNYQPLFNISSQISMQKYQFALNQLDKIMLINTNKCIDE